MKKLHGFAVMACAAAVAIFASVAGPGKTESPPGKIALTASPPEQLVGSESVITGFAATTLPQDAQVGSQISVVIVAEGTLNTALVSQFNEKEVAVCHQLAAGVISFAGHEATTFAAHAALAPKAIPLAVAMG